MKKDSKKGLSPVVPLTSNCGRKGCEIPYVMPYGGTQEDFERHRKEKFKSYPKQAA